MVDLFINLRGSNVNPKEVVKNLINFKSDLGEIRKGNPKSKTENWFFLEIILLCYLDLNTKQNMEGVSKY